MAGGTPAWHWELAVQHIQLRQRTGRRPRYEEKRLDEFTTDTIYVVPGLSSLMMRNQSPIALLYYSSVVGYLALYDLLAITLPANIIISFADTIFFILSLLFIVGFLRGEYSVPIWRRGANISIILFLIVIIIFPFVGYIFYSHSIGVFTSPIRKLQLFLFFPITASLIHEDKIRLHHIYAAFLLIVILHVTVGTVRLFEIDRVLFSLEFESLLTAATVHATPTRSAGLFGSIPWFGSLMAMLFMYGIAGLYNKAISVKVVISLLTLSFLGIIIAISRTAIIMILPGIGVLAWYSVQQDTRLVMTGAALTVGFSVINRITGGGTLDRFAEMKNLLTGDLSEISALDARFELWQSGIVAFEEFTPFGTLVSHSYVIDLTIDNVYISTYLQSGFIGIGILLFLCVSLIICGFAEVMEKGHLFSGIIMVLITIAFVIGGITMSITGFIPAVVVFWITIGITVGTQEETSKITIRG